MVRISFFSSLLILDVLSKIVALKWIPPLLPKIFGFPFGGIRVFDIGSIQFSLNVVTNSGAAWGSFQGYAGLLFALRFAIILGLIVYASRNKMNLFPLWIVITGAIGNGIDYLIYGHVIDFLHFSFWGYSFPLFNFADSYITVGVLLLLCIPRKVPSVQV